MRLTLTVEATPGAMRALAQLLEAWKLAEPSAAFTHLQTTVASAEKDPDDIVQTLMALGDGGYVVAQTHPSEVRYCEEPQ